VRGLSNANLVVPTPKIPVCRAVNMHSSVLPDRLGRVVPTLVCSAANAAWRIAQIFNAILPKGRPLHPSWAPGPFFSVGNSSLPLYLPRVTDSLCPKCSFEARDRVVCQRGSLENFKGNPGIVCAHIVEEAGQVLMRKMCEKHGPFEDLLATNAEFFQRIESLYRGRDFACVDDNQVHDHGVSSIRYGRGSFLVVDLTNRCNMKCTPCFMDANSGGHVHEVPIEDVKAMLHRALSFKPRRDVNIFFSGGEPTLYPHFLEAVRYAKGLGFQRLHVATNGLRFAQDPNFAARTRAAGLHSVYLQFDGVSNAKNSHRGVENLFDVKQQALDNIARAGLRTTLQSTIIRGVNDDQVGPIVDFVIENSGEIFGVVFQPIMFAGRDEDVEDERRYEQRYTLSQLAEDLQTQAQRDWQPLRDWFPLSAVHEFSILVDLLSGPGADLGAVAFNHHPDFAVVSPLVVNQRTKCWTPLGAFFGVERFLTDIAAICHAGRGRTWTLSQLRLAVLRNFLPDQAPTGFGPGDLFDLFNQCVARTSAAAENWREREIESGEWRFLLIKGMWFQDLFNFDLRNIEMSTTPVATQEGEISFCAYNAGGWRQIVESQYQTASLSEWHRQHGRHPIYANGQLVQLQPTSPPVSGAEISTGAVCVRPDES
jgi:7,8-dihydro-6-hydroxymethylpterin dimethyltransferase